MNLREKINAFLAGQRFAVVGASQDRAKYANKVLRAYQQNGLTVYPVNPGAGEVEGLTAYPNLGAIPGGVDGISIVTPPGVTEQVVQEGIELGIRNMWLQPGAESPTAIELAEGSGVNVIAGGPCALVALGYHEEPD